MARDIRIQGEAAQYVDNLAADMGIDTDKALELCLALTERLFKRGFLQVHSDTGQVYLTVKKSSDALESTLLTCNLNNIRSTVH